MTEKQIQLAYTIRAFELEIEKQFKAGIIKGTVHLSMGQECSDVEIITAYENPMVFGNHRSHGQYIATTGDIAGCYQQILQNRTQHLYYPDKFLATGVQGGLCPVAVGNALAFKMKGIHRRVLVFIGDGTLGQGVFWESLNFAAINQLPMTFIIVDNGYSMSKTKLGMNIWEIAELFDAYYGEAGDEPVTGLSILYRRVPRLCGHSINDTQTYRPKDELLKDCLNHDIQSHYYEEQAEQIIQTHIGR